MIKVFPFIFIILWSSAFITTKPLTDNSDPFSALAFRFFLVSLGFAIYSIYTKQKLLVNKKSYLYLVGTTLEFSDGLNGKGFVFNNPNASRTCGCGESFSL